MFDQEIETLRNKRKRLIRKVMLAVMYSILALWAAWLISIAAQHFSMDSGSGEAVGKESDKESDKGIAPSTTLLKEVDIAEANSAATPPALTSEDTKLARKVFQQQLVALDTTHNIILTDPDFLQWLTASKQLNKKVAVTSSKEKALTLFASAHYQDAIVELQQTDEMAKALTQSWHQTYEDKLQQAQQAYDKENVKPAELYINQALAIKPNEPRGLSLRQQLISYPRVAALLAELNVAKIENNLQKQADMLQQIIAQDSTRTERVQELSAVTKKLNDQSFQQAINRGIVAIEQQNISLASAAYRQAKSIYPQRAEVSSLQQKISQQQAAANLKMALANVKQAAQADDWSTVLAITSNKSHSTSAVLEEYKKNAQDILQQQKTAASYLARPERLQDQGIRQQAQAFVKSHIMLALKSPTFAQQIEQLSKKLDDASQKQTLRITSNGQTDIWVLGVGHVGKVNQSTEKTIQLYPGQYIVEGRCEGYRHKQQSITVSSSSVGDIYLVCDERI